MTTRECQSILNSLKESTRMINEKIRQFLDREISKADLLAAIADIDNTTQHVNEQIRKALERNRLGKGDA